MTFPRLIAIVPLALGLLWSCADDGLSSAELTAAAKERVREQLGLAPDATLFSSTFVARSDDDVVLCGRVAGTSARGEPVPERRFIAATDPARWVRFEAPAAEGTSPHQFSQDWAHICAGERTT